MNIPIESLDPINIALLAEELASAIRIEHAAYQKQYEAEGEYQRAKEQVQIAGGKRRQAEMRYRYAAIGAKFPDFSEHWSQE